MSDRYVIVRREAPDAPLYGTHDIGSAIRERTRMVVADRSLRDVLVVMETPRHGTTDAARQVFPRVAEVQP